jgi:DNA-binding transcriptional MerR regulator
MEQNYGIGETAQISGVTIKQLRHWEDAGYIPKPERIKCGARSYRRFFKSQVEFIILIKKNLDRGFTLSTSVDIAKKNIEKGEEE